METSPTVQCKYSPLSAGDFSDKESNQQVQVEFYVHEQTFKERLQLYFIKNQRSSVRIRLFNFTIKLISCALYVVRACLDTNPRNANCYGCNEQDGFVEPSNTTCCEPCGSVPSIGCMESPENINSDPNDHIRWVALLWVERHTWLWALQVAIAIISLLQAILLLCLQYKGNLLNQILSVFLIIEFINSVPFIFTIFSKPLRNLFIPVFLNCWLAKNLLQNLFYDLHRVMQKQHSVVTQKVMILVSTILCLIFTSVCGIHHIQRADGDANGMSFFVAIYFTIVTFSTVGYGDIQVYIWPSQFYILCMIASAIVVLPIQLEEIAYVMIERQKQGGTYSRHRAQNERHVVVCSTTLHYDQFIDFLYEFYAHPLLQDYFVVLLSPCELDLSLKTLLQVPLWAQRVIYIQGSALKDHDLNRCRMDDAEACFILTSRNSMDRGEADQQAILRAWAIKDFARQVPLFVQMLKPENKFHVQFAEYVVCEDEFKYALLANNCLCPGTSTFVTLLIHTSRGVEGRDTDTWHHMYGKCSGNEVYNITCGSSRFFGEYEGKSFTFASFHAHKKYGVALVGLQKAEPSARIMLNPGPRHILKATDTCFYMNITREENSAFISHSPKDEKQREKCLIGKANDHSPSDGDPSAFQTAIAGVGTIALELHHIGGSKSPTTSPHHVPNADKEEDKSHTPPLGRSAAEGLHIKMPSRSSEIGGMDNNHLMPPNMDEQEPQRLPIELPPEATGYRRERRPSIMPVQEVMSSDPEDDQLKDEKPLHAQKQVAIEAEDVSIWDEEDPWTKGLPPITPYIGYSPSYCHLLSKPKNICCLELDQPCEHSSWRHAAEYNWPNNNIILAAEYASVAMVDFVVPLRTHWRPKHSLKPIVIIIEKRPDTCFLESMACFPMVYYMMGSIENLDHMLRAGILQSDTVVVVDKESSKLAEEEYMADANQIVAVQTLFKLFPHVSIITELTHPSNMRFMQFRAKDSYAHKMALKTKEEKEKGSQIAYMFRLPFAAGNVFSASMLDTLLYQSFVKNYMINFSRQLLGLDQAQDSGYLCELRITSEDIWIRTYGRLYQKLCSTTHEIPIGIYRTELPTDNKSECSVSMDFEENSSCGSPEEKKEIASIIRAKMKKLDLPEEEYEELYGFSKYKGSSKHGQASDNEGSGKRNREVSYVLINPSSSLELRVDDVVFIIRPSGGPKTPSPMPPRRKFSSRRRPSKKPVEPKLEFQAPSPVKANLDTKL
ncbi:potassium channel subfamily T member 2-like isoform X3 [Apostichopus japonicus]|uniref:potassium channel subfamily T member 2-like isoform X3 n=1 Tax=Stichopus japonicus TaxID=307972 RepID=UPI003AB7E787